jgi:hypothetical protein
MPTLWALLSSFVSPGADVAKAGQDLATKAVPGLMTVLDLALLRAVEQEMTGTLTTSHAVLAALIDLKKQAKAVIYLIREEGLLPSPDTPNQSTTQSNKALVESFARACLDASCDIIELLSTDKFAETANLSDPYESLSGNSPQTAAANTAETTPELPTSPLAADEDLTATTVPTGVTSSLTRLSVNSSTGVDKPSLETNTDDWWKALDDSVADTGRRIPLAQRPRDLWETARLQCPDYRWAEECLRSSEGILRFLVKHPLVSEVNHAQASHLARRNRTSTLSPTVSSFSLHVREEIMVLLQLVLVDVPARLIQFQAASEAESMVLQRLYMLKCESRAAFRAFLEAHQSVLKAPSLSTVEDYMSTTKNKFDREQKKKKAKAKLQKLVETPALVECLTLEQTCQYLEIEISKAIYPFCELARYLDHKRATVQKLPDEADRAKLVDLQIILHRFKGLLTRKSSGHDSSVGIRPLLMDLQGIPREDEVQSQSTEHCTSENWEVRVDGLIEQLELLNTLCRTRTAFRSDKKAVVEAPAPVVERCARLDVELFRCHFLDWFMLVKQQNELSTTHQFSNLAEDIRQAELEVSLAAITTTEALQVIAQRLHVLEQDRGKRFRVLEEVIYDVGRSSLNLSISVSPPDSREVLELRPTSAKGVFGDSLESVGETLPIG